MKKRLFLLFIALGFLLSFESQWVPNADAQTTSEQKQATNLKDYVGRFEADPSVVENSIFDISLENGELWFKPSHEPKRKLIAKSTDSFVISDLDIPIKIIRDAKGIVTGLSIESFPLSNGKTLTARKLVLPPASLKGNTTFRLKGFPKAAVVAVAGTFNDWNQSQLLFGKEGDEWVCRVDLAPGKYTYKFIIDGNWILDPENPNTEDDDRGITNSVLVVKK